MFRNLIIITLVSSVAIVGCNTGDNVDLRTEVEALRAENAALRADNEQLKGALAAQAAQKTKQVSDNTLPVSHTDSLFERGILRFPDNVEKAMMGDAFRQTARPPVVRFENLKIEENAHQDWLPVTPEPNEE